MGKQWKQCQTLIFWAPKSLQMEIRPDVDGEERVIALDVTLDCDIKIYEDQTMTYVDDGYKMDAKLVPEYRMFDFETLIGKNQAIMKAAKKFPIQQEPGKLLQVLSVKGSCNIDEIEMTDQGLNVEGVWIADVLYLSSEDQTPVMSDSYMEPFTFFVEARGLNEGDDYQVDVRLDQMTGMPTEGDEIEIKVSIVFDFISFRKKQQRVMIHVNEEPLDYEMIQQIPGIVGYIVKEDDTLWSIAKTFFTTIESIREQNDGIEEVNPGDKLLIVKELGYK